MSISVVKDALEYYDRNMENYEKLVHQIRYVKLTNNNKKTGVYGLYHTFYDKHKNELFTSRTEILAKYYDKLKIWVWGWGIASIDASFATIIRKVLLYGTGIQINDDAKHMIWLKNELVTSRIKMTDEAQLDIHCAIACYLSKQVLILPIQDFPHIVDGIAEISIKKTNRPTNDKVFSTLYLFILDPPKLD